MINFTWDNDKAETNQRKHGISFDEAKTTFNDDFGRMIFDPDHSESEDRFILLGMSCSLKILTVCHCYRCNDSEIRIISARKATKKETSQYRRLRK
jgi:uncharacterized DUF497 family protein